MTTLVDNIQNLAEAIRDKLNLMNTALRPAAITVVVDGGGIVVASGVKIDVVVPFECVITGWTILADQVGSAEFDIWKTDYTNAPATVSDSIVGTHPPTLEMTDKAQSTDLSDWNLIAHENDVIRVALNSASIVTRLTLTLLVLRD